MFDRSLSVEAYDKAEAKALESVPNRIIECSGTVTFSSLGYPTRVKTQAALGRYVDVMHEGRAEATFQQFLQGVTEEELGLLRRVSEAIAVNSEQNYGRRAVATGSLLRALVIVRTITALYPDKSSLIFEIGHGCGYVGALLLAQGYAYASTDIAQAFYVYQNNLLNRLVPGKVRELATSSGGMEDIGAIKPGHAVHIPWWKFYRATPNPAFSANAVTCNHALAEMHPNSLSYVLKVAKLVLKESDSAFVFEGWGSTVSNPIWTISKRFSDLGYTIAHNNITGSVFAPEGSGFADGALSLPLPHRTDPVFDAEPYGNAAFIQQFHPPIHINPDSAASSAILADNSAREAQPTRSYEDVCNMFRSVLKHDDLRSEDEKFSLFTDSPY